MIHRYLTMRQVAAALGVSHSWLYDNVARLEREHGFPASAPGMGKRRDGAAIEAWQNRQLPPELRPADTAPPADELAAWSEEYDRRLDQFAGDA